MAVAAQNIHLLLFFLLLASNMDFLHTFIFFLIIITIRIHPSSCVFASKSFSYIIFQYHTACRSLSKQLHSLNFHWKSDFELQRLSDVNLHLRERYSWAQLHPNSHRKVELSHLHSLGMFLRVVVQINKDFLPDRIRQHRRQRGNMEEKRKKGKIRPFNISKTYI